MASYSAINNNNGSSQYLAGAGAGSPYNQPAYNDSGYIAPIAARKKKVSPWLKFGLPAAVIVIAGVVVAIIFTRKHSSSGGTSSAVASASQANSAKNAVGLFATATNSEFMVPIYPSAVSILVLSQKYNTLKLTRLNRPTRLRTPVPPSTPPPTRAILGPQTPSNPAAPTSTPLAQTVPSSSPLHTNGTPSPPSSKTTYT
jgi:hypothetical protein